MDDELVYMEACKRLSEAKRKLAEAECELIAAEREVRATAFMSQYNKAVNNLK